MTKIGFVILILIVLLAVWVYTVLAAMPGQKAREFGHPQARAINVLGWLGLLIGVVPWLIAMVWAHMSPVLPQAPRADLDSPAE